MYNELNKQYNELNDSYNSVEKEKNDIVEKYNNIINSKGWKFLERIRKIKLKEEKNDKKEENKTNS